MYFKRCSKISEKKQLLILRNQTVNKTKLPKIRLHSAAAVNPESG